MKLNGYYTKEAEDPAVYHVLRYCPTGKTIKRWHRQKGRIPITGRRACEDCERLTREWLLTLPSGS
jgi:hypothetical protein